MNMKKQHLSLWTRCAVLVILNMFFSAQGIYVDDVVVQFHSVSESNQKLAPRSPLEDSQFKAFEAFLSQELSPILMDMFQQGFVNPARLNSLLESLSKLGESLPSEVSESFPKIISGIDTYTEREKYSSFFKLVRTLNDKVLSQRGYLFFIEAYGGQGALRWEATLIEIYPAQTEHYFFQGETIPLYFIKRYLNKDFNAPAAFFSPLIGAAIDSDGMKKYASFVSGGMEGVRNELRGSRLSQLGFLQRHLYLGWMERGHGGSPTPESFASGEVEYERWHELRHAADHIRSLKAYETMDAESRSRIDRLEPSFISLKSVSFVESQLKRTGKLWAFYSTYPIENLSTISHVSPEAMKGRSTWEVAGHLEAIIQSENPGRQLALVFGNYLASEAQGRPSFQVEHVLLSLLFGLKLPGGEQVDFDGLLQGGMRWVAQEMLPLSDEQIRALANEIMQEEFLVRLNFEGREIREEVSLEEDTQWPSVSEGIQIGSSGQLTSKLASYMKDETTKRKIVEIMFKGPITNLQDLVGNLDNLKNLLRLDDDGFRQLKEDLEEYQAGRGDQVVHRINSEIGSTFNRQELLAALVYEMNKAAVEQASSITTTDLAAVRLLQMGL